MKCYDCNKYLKKGHGKNLYHYAGQWRYFCFFCLKINNYHYQVRQKSSAYYSGLSLICFLLTVFIWAITKYLTKSPWNNLLTYHLAIAIIPAIIVYLLISNIVIKPKLETFKQQRWLPLQKEQNQIKVMENYVNSLIKRTSKEICLCEKCLEIEWKKAKNK